MRPTKQQDYQLITPRSPERILKKRLINNQIQYLMKWKGTDQTTWEYEQNVRRSILEEFLQNQQSYQEQKQKNLKNVAQQLPVMQQVQQSLKHPSYSEELLLNKQKEMAQKFCSSYPQKCDEIDSVHLMLTNEDCVFEVKWKPRADGVVPISDFYQYDQFKLAAPLLFMNFLENCIVGHENNADIKFYAPGKDNVERAQLIKQILLRNPKYTDTNKQPSYVHAEEQKQQDPPIQQNKNAIINFTQSDSKKTILNQPTALSDKNQCEQQESEMKNHIILQESQEVQQQLDSTSQQEPQQQQSNDEREPGEMVDPEENQLIDEQLDQRSISLEPQK
ncbi:unnamed protein product (macronuclear) [Paramecium tetraurelia]|uniref:Chromosome undetermined scaffold_1, whole genome shotgun sequence n=1 Tax=Paramecium tetraurelia TaxID=5888 RepID=Q6BG04_PARTE|nr:hypothetical protein [Paramecium tetraurelia strain d4-2]XP_001423264.1 uncharacterized protein GSPATT00000301001 [Paramecium tetraurelia]CAH03416.1 hypothetical protein PTMB.219 [Paramecium tetraurelia]CAK55866.1 unnamed protein product [Paramecium tetraurelia]|eukprot:XP_001423264.1 hypothetical protein (macronuclear) [Paramecium tetraurelia strain d4-2]